MQKSEQVDAAAAFAEPDVGSPPTRIEVAILKLLESDNYLSFVELDRIEGFSGGHFCLEPRPNVVIWCNMTEAGIDAVNTLKRERKIRMAPTSLLTYLADGRALNLPIATSIRTYKKLHWLPTTICRP
jgi:hypothetical protein